MDVLKAIKTRKSIRGYKSTPVPKEILREIIDAARRSPSDVNAQPWEITVVAGEVLDNIRRGNIEKLISGAMPSSDVPELHYEGEYRRRQVGLAIQLFGLMGIARKDTEKRKDWRQRGFRFFDAPAAIMLSVDRGVLEGYAQFDIGCITHAICLAALNYGLGTCIEDQGIMFPEVVREFTNIPESKILVAGIAIGYPDWEFPANKVQSEREPVDSIVTWCGFD